MSVDKNTMRRRDGWRQPEKIWMLPKPYRIIENTLTLVFRPAIRRKSPQGIMDFLGRISAWGYSIQKLVSELPDPEMRRHLADFLELGAVLDRYYISTRYPNGLPDLTPGKVYFQKDVCSVCIGAAQRLLERVKESWAHPDLASQEPEPWGTRGQIPGGTLRTLQRPMASGASE